MAISNMQQAQQLRANGGIMTIPRQKYGLGKLVKKAVRAEVLIVVILLLITVTVGVPADVTFRDLII